MLAHTFRGGSFWASLLGIADERQAFGRYRELRKAERTHV
jgi:hypothetical protein